MRFALAQMDVLPGQPEKNLENMLSMIEDAKQQGVDLIAFPEMAVGGYLVGDNFQSDEFCEDLMEYDEDLKEASHGIAIAYGNVFSDVNKGNEDGRSRKYNAVRVFQNGKEAERAKPNSLPDGLQTKTLLPNYRFFDDKRYFHSTRQISEDTGEPLSDLLQPFVLDINGRETKIGFQVCEDLWSDDYRKDGWMLSPTKILIENGAEAIVNVSSSPWTSGKNDARDRKIKSRYEENWQKFVPFLYVNNVGAQNNGKNIVTFDGGSTAYNSHGDPVKFANEDFEQELLIIDSDDLRKVGSERTAKSPIAEKYKAIIRGIQHAKDIAGAPHQPGYVIGLSGGIDSAVSAALISLAVGSEKVMGINMPSQYNSDKTKDSAAHLAKELGITYQVVPIEELVEVNNRLLDIDMDGSGKEQSPLNAQNVQAKIRGVSLLSNIAAKYNRMFTNNGNKLETALGYATLDGDMRGALAPLADLTKAEVFEMATYLNEVVFGREVIPNSLIPDELYRFSDDQIEPSAELENAQVDPMKFGYHDALLEKFMDYNSVGPSTVLDWYLEGTMEENLGVSYDLLERWDITNPEEFVKDLEWFSRNVNWSVFKRVQTCANIVTSKTAYGYDRRESMLPSVQTRRFRRLKEEVLAQDAYVSDSLCEVLV